MSYKLLHNDQNFNFQFNRLLSYGKFACDEDEIQKIASNVINFETWYEEFLKYAIIAENQKRFSHSMYYYRMAEFFLSDIDSRKNQMFYKMKEMFIFAFPEVQIDKVLFKDSYLPCIKVNIENPKDTIIVHGGYDSFIEEFYLICLDLSKDGYNIILFEGEGQGTTLRNGLRFNYQWENSVTTLLDYYEIDKCTILGISWGGYFALRAAAFDSRIKNVISYDVLFDGLDVQFSLFKGIKKYIAYFLFMTKSKKTMNRIVTKAMSKSSLAKWSIEHGMYITGTSSTYDFYENIEKHTLKKIGNRVYSNVLLLAGEKDHYIPFSHLNKTKDELKNANISSKMFTIDEGGEQHCQVGNFPLALNEIKKWLLHIYN